MISSQSPNRPANEGPLHLGTASASPRPTRSPPNLAGGTGAENKSVHDTRDACRMRGEKPRWATPFRFLLADDRPFVASQQRKQGKRNSLPSAVTIRGDASRASPAASISRSDDENTTSPGTPNIPETSTRDSKYFGSWPCVPLRASSGTPNILDMSARDSKYFGSWAGVPLRASSGTPNIPYMSARDSKYFGSWHCLSRRS